MPKSSLEALQTLEDLSSPIAAFLRDWCVVGSTKAIPVRTLYDAHTKWCEMAGHTSGSSSVFGRNLMAAAPRVQTRGRHPKRTYIGVDLSAEERDAYESFGRFDHRP